MRSLKRLMKSDREVREICKRETDAYLRENYEQIAKQAAYQTIAVTFVVLHRYFGFGGRRLEPAEGTHRIRVCHDENRDIRQEVRCRRLHKVLEGAVRH